MNAKQGSCPVDTIYFGFMWNRSLTDSRHIVAINDILQLCFSLCAHSISHLN